MKIIWGCFYAGHVSPTKQICLALLLPPDASGKHISLRGAPLMLLLIAAAQQAAHPCIMPPNGSTTGKCQSRDFGICRRRKAKHLASVSPLSLTQHIAKGTCPLCRTSSEVSHVMHSVRDTTEVEAALEPYVRVLLSLSLAPPQELLSVIGSLVYLQPHLACATSPFSGWQNTLAGPILTGQTVCKHNVARKKCQLQRFLVPHRAWYCLSPACSGSVMLAPELGVESLLVFWCKYQN